MSRIELFSAITKLLHDHLEHEMQAFRLQDSSSSERIGYPESEAAELLGIEQHVLRDCRQRGEIVAKKVGRRFIYSRAALEDWLTT